MSITQNPTLLNKRYEIIELLGNGGMSNVYLAKDTVTGEAVAIKQMQAVRKTKSDTAKYFKEETLLLTENTACKSLVRIKEAFEEDGRRFYSMEYIPGKNAFNLVKGFNGKLPLERIARISSNFLDGLIDIHLHNIWHRDLSPENIIIGNNDSVRIIDFGNACEGVKSNQRRVNFAKHNYAPIELVDSDYLQGPWTDVYMAGATIYFLLTSQKPTESAKRLRGETMCSISDIRKDVNNCTVQAIEKAMSLLPNERYQTVREFKESLIW